MLVNLKESTSYSTVREAVRSWDMQTYKWAESISYYQRHQEANASDSTAMEVDRVSKGKGKDGKSKGKGKGKDAKGKGKGKWSNFTSYQSHNDKGQGKGKAKSKGKGEDSKGKSKGKGKQQQKDSCYYCGKPGHRQDACWKKQQDEAAKGVRFVEQPESGAASTVTTVGPSASQVRRLDLDNSEPTYVLYHIGDENDEVEDRALNVQFSRAVKEVRVPCPVYPMDDTDDDGDWTTVCLEDSGPGEVTTTGFTACDVCNDHAHGEEDSHVRALRKGPLAVEAILDSGNDMTVLPVTCQDLGVPQGQAPVLKDAQGNKLSVRAQRKVELIFQAVTGEKIKVRQLATVAESVRHC